MGVLESWVACVGILGGVAIIVCIVERWLHIERADTQAPPPPPLPELTPGECECGHLRCTHVDGKGGCTVRYPADKEWPNGAICACKIFIFDPDSDDDEDEDEDQDPTPSPEELERIYNK